MSPPTSRCRSWCRKPVIPDDLQVSPALEEVLKLAQAGVSQEVMLAYITHSTTFFNVTSDAIVYLNDLGVSNDVITALIQHDSTPEMQARKQIANSVQPLPKDLALTSPATNVYPPSVTQTTDAAPVDTNVPRHRRTRKSRTLLHRLSSRRACLIFTVPWRLTAHGSTSMDTACAGSRRWWWVIPVGVRLPTVAAGSGRTTAGIGIRITRGAGRRFTTVAGAVIRAWAGFGCPARIGVRRG